MKKLIAAGIAAALIVPAAYVAAQVSIPYVTALGQNDIMQVIPNAAPQVGNQYATLTQLRGWILGGSTLHNGTPVLTTCGGGTPAITGSDWGGRITVGTSATACTATFAQAFTNIPSCIVVSQTAPGTTTPAYTVSATAIVIAQTSTSSNIYDYICVARNGG